MEFDEWYALGRERGWIEDDSKWKRHPSAYTRVMVRSVAAGDCFVFVHGSRNPDGYGRVRSGGAEKMAHRIVWEHHNGPIPDGMIIRHTCDNPPCVRIEHLEIGTFGDNARDRMARNRSPVGENHYRAKLTWEIVALIRESSEPSRVLGRRYGVSHGAILAIRNGKTWKVAP